MNIHIFFLYHFMRGQNFCPRIYTCMTMMQKRICVYSFAPVGGKRSERMLAYANKKEIPFCPRRGQKGHVRKKAFCPRRGQKRIKAYPFGCAKHKKKAYPNGYAFMRFGVTHPLQDGFPVNLCWITHLRCHTHIL